jgi:hypothetical protein
VVYIYTIDARSSTVGNASVTIMSATTYNWKEQTYSFLQLVQWRIIASFKSGGSKSIILALIRNLLGHFALLCNLSMVVQSRLECDGFRFRSNAPSFHFFLRLHRVSLCVTSGHNHVPKQFLKVIVFGIIGVEHMNKTFAATKLTYKLPLHRTILQSQVLYLVVRSGFEGLGPLSLAIV